LYWVRPRHKGVLTLFDRAEESLEGSASPLTIPTKAPGCRLVGTGSESHPDRLGSARTIGCVFAYAERNLSVPARAPTLLPQVLGFGKLLPVSSLLFSQRPFIRTGPTVAVSEGVTARISLVQQHDPSVFILDPPKPVDPPVLLTFQPRLIVHRCTLPLGLHAHVPLNLVPTAITRWLRCRRFSVIRLPVVCIKSAHQRKTLRIGNPSLEVSFSVNSRGQRSKAGQVTAILVLRFMAF
jgi:hypothetical protein